MADVIFLLITVAFFALCVGFVRVCDRIIGPDDEQGPLTDVGEADVTEPLDAPARELAVGSTR